MMSSSGHDPDQGSLPVAKQRRASIPRFQSPTMSTPVGTSRDIPNSVRRHVGEFAAGRRDALGIQRLRRPMVVCWRICTPCRF